MPTYEILAASLGLQLIPGASEHYRPRYNVAPSDTTWVVREQGDARRLEAMVWGLVPRWSKSASQAKRPINARAESLEERPTFKDSYAARRCIVVSDGFLEWEKRGGQKTPIWFVPRDGGLLLMGGLYDEWVDPESRERLRTFAIVTTAPNREVASIHDRMPLVLAKDDLDHWLHAPSPGRAAQVTDDVRALLRSAPDGSLLKKVVARRIGSPRNDDPSVLLPDNEHPVAERVAAPPSKEQRRGENLSLFEEAVPKRKAR